MKQRCLLRDLTAIVLFLAVFGFCSPAFSQQSSQSRPQSSSAAGAASPVAFAKLRSVFSEAPVKAALNKDKGAATPRLSAFPISVYRNKEFLLAGFVAVDPKTCEFRDNGTYTTTLAPTRGSLIYRIETGVSQSGACIGHTYQFNVSYYIWTDSAAVAGATDHFAFHYENSAGTFDADVVATLTAPKVDVDATGPPDILCPGAKISDPSRGSASRGCTVWSVAPLTVSLTLHDIPLSYRPPKGPVIDLGLYYAHRDVRNRGQDR